MKIGVLILSIFLLCNVFACTQQQRTVHLVEIPANRKFINITWKINKDNASLWVLTRDRAVSDNKETFYFNEQSQWGVFEGQIIIIEK